MTIGDLKQLVQEALKEQNVSGAVGSYSTPKAFRKTGKPFHKVATRPKRPSHTKMFDFI